MKALEERAFSEGVSADGLMEEAGYRIALAVRQFFPRPGVCVAVFGKGNNGGDALVAARHLAAWGWNVWLIAGYPDSQWSPVTAAKFAAATGCHRTEVAQLESISGEPLVALDGLLGTGASGPLSEPLSVITQAINQRRRSSNATVFALDLPTGLDGNTGTADPACIVADHTLTIGFAKQGLFADSAINFVGRMSVLPLRELSMRLDSSHADALPSTPAVLAPVLARRHFETHKGDCGRIGIVAGSQGYLGAAVLCSAACVRAGAGLVTLYAQPDVADALARMVLPEVMVRPLPPLGQLSAQRYDTFAIGPGLGQQLPSDFTRFIRNIPVPVVLDADGLTSLASNIEALSRADGERVLTPHVGEMERLVPGSKSRPRREVVEAFTKRFPVTLLLKGARTIIGKAGEPLSYNTTGTPGMAVGGMGDALTGVIAALIGQKIRPFDAARLGAWLCGRASEIAISVGGESEESLTPGRMLDFLGQAFRDLRSDCF